MQNVLVTIIGKDRPGLVHIVSSALFERGCALAELTQTTLLGQFAGLFLSKAPEGLDLEALSAGLKEKLRDKGFSAWAALLPDEPEKESEEREPYVLTIAGPDDPGLVPAITGAIASFDANIDNLRSVSLSGGVAAPLVLVLELSVPMEVQRSVFRQALQLAAEELGAEASLQHRDIFEAIHRL